MFIPYPDFCPSRISDPGQNSNKREEWKISLLSYFFCSHKYNKIEKKKILTGEEQNFGQFSEFTKN